MRGDSFDHKRRAGRTATVGLDSNAPAARKCRPPPAAPRPGAPMIVGVPREVKSDEYRVALIPVGAEELKRAGHRVLVQAGAGQGSGLADDRYAASGAEIVPDAATIWREADLIVKVKEPMPDEWALMRPG